jgi:hypothetical protein
VVEVEGRMLKLTGTAEEQYREWRKLLAEWYRSESGGPPPTMQPPALAPAPAAAPTPAPAAAAAAASTPTGTAVVTPDAAATAAPKQ